MHSGFFRNLRNPRCADASATVATESSAAWGELPMCARRSPEAGAHGPERDAAHARAADDGPLVNGREKVPPVHHAHKGTVPITSASGESRSFSFSASSNEHALASDWPVEKRVAPSTTLKSFGFRPVWLLLNCARTRLLPVRAGDVQRADGGPADHRELRPEEAQLVGAASGSEPAMQ